VITAIANSNPRSTWRYVRAQERPSNIPEDVGMAAALDGVQVQSARIRLPAKIIPFVLPDLRGKALPREIQVRLDSVKPEHHCYESGLT
jgi:hypothetical protein